MHGHDYDKTHIVANIWLFFCYNTFIIIVFICWFLNLTKLIIKTNKNVCNVKIWIDRNKNLIIFRAKKEHIYFEILQQSEWLQFTHHVNIVSTFRTTYTRDKSSNGTLVENILTLPYQKKWSKYKRKYTKQNIESWRQSNI